MALGYTVALNTQSLSKMSKYTGTLVVITDVVITDEQDEQVHRDRRPAATGS